MYGKSPQIWKNAIWGLGDGLGSSSPGEFHPQALTDPYVSLSTHTALAVPAIISFVFVMNSPTWWFAHLVNRTAQPLRSTPLSGASSLLRIAPPLLPPSVLSRLLFAFALFPSHETADSHVPHSCLDRGHAASMPDAARPRMHAPAALLPEFTSRLWFRHRPFAISTLVQRLTFAHLLCPYLSLTLTTTPFQRSRSRRVWRLLVQADAEGASLISNAAFVAHGRCCLTRKIG